MNTTTEHEHDARSYEFLQDTLSTTRCDCDWNIVGGPVEHSGERFVEHVRYTDSCYVAVVCAAHLPYSLVFVSREMPAINCIELETLTEEAERTLLNTLRYGSKSPSV